MNFSKYNKLIILNVKMERGLGRDLELLEVEQVSYLQLSEESYPLELELHPAEFQLWENSLHHENQKCLPNHINY